MQPSDYTKFLTMLNALGEYYNREVTEGMQEIYLAGLKQYDYEAISRAAQLHMANPDAGQFFPKIADFVRHLAGGNADRSLVAWAKVDRAVRTIGDHRSVVFDDPIIHSVVSDMGGWIGFGMCDIEEWPFKQNEFVKRYRGYIERGDVGEYPAKLCGMHDSYNRQIGKENDQETVLLGDKTKAMEVFRLGSDGAAKSSAMLLSDAAKVVGGNKEIPWLADKQGAIH